MNKVSLGHPVENTAMCGPVENLVIVQAGWDTGMMFSQSRLMNYLDLWQDYLEGNT